MISLPRYISSDNVRFLAVKHVLKTTHFVNSHFAELTQYSALIGQQSQYSALIGQRSKGQYKQRKCDCGKEKDHQRMRVITDYRARDSCYAEARV